MLVSLHRHSLSEMRTTPSKEPKDQAHNDHRSNMAYVHVRSARHHGQRASTQPTAMMQPSAKTPWASNGEI